MHHWGMLGGERRHVSRIAIVVAAGSSLVTYYGRLSSVTATDTATRLAPRRYMCGLHRGIPE